MIYCRHRELEPKLSVSYVDLVSEQLGRNGAHILHRIQPHYQCYDQDISNPALLCAITWTDRIVLRMGVSSIPYMILNYPTYEQLLISSIVVH